MRLFERIVTRNGIGKKAKTTTLGLKAIRNYLKSVDLSGVPSWDRNQEVKILQLVQGECNLNFLPQQGSKKWVLRVNLGTQINRDDQILYEYQTLKIQVLRPVHFMSTIAGNTCRMVF